MYKLIVREAKKTMTKEEMLKIIRAIKTGDVGYIKNLSDGSIDCQTTLLIDEKGDQLPAIHYASRYGQLEIVQLLLIRNIGLLDVKDTFSQTPICFAAAYGHAHVVEHLAKLGADLTIVTNSPGHRAHGFLPIDWAIYREHYAVVQTLVDHSAKIDMRFGEQQIHLIHLASKRGLVDVAKIFLNKEPGLLNLMDAHGQTPLLWAAARGHVHVVEYLTSAGADVEMAINRPNHADHGKTPLTRALEGKHYDAANVLILKRAAYQSKESILPFVQTKDQALALMMLDPTLADIFLQEERIASLIKTPDRNITPRSISWYKPRLERRPSFFMRFNREDKTLLVFNPVKVIGKGAVGVVRLFQSAEGHAIAVKSLKDDVVNVSQDQRCELTRQSQREAEFNNKAYPDDSLSETFDFDYQMFGNEMYSNRHVMPYIKGDNAQVLIPKITCPYQLAEITLQIALELQRIHKIGIIHGDLHTANIMIHRENMKFIIRLIDFGFSSYITEESATLWPLNTGDWMPPEICNGSKTAVRPHPSQDVYALGFSLRFILEKHPLYQEVMELFPSISLFMLSSQDINPRRRPLLESFCTELQADIISKTAMRLLPNDANAVSQVECDAERTVSTANCC